MQLNSISGQAAASAVWANATRSLTIQHGTTFGYQVRSVVTSGGLLLTASGVQAVYTQASNAGVLLAIGFQVNVALSGGTVSAQIEIIIDGQTTTVMFLYAAGLVFLGGGLVLANRSNGTGTNIGDSVMWELGLGWGTSITVNVNVTATTLATGQFNWYTLASHA